MTNQATDDDQELVLREDRIIATVATLRRRIEERFPSSGLSSLCQRLLQVAEQSAKRADAIAKPSRLIRLVGYSVASLLIALMIASVVYAVRQIDPTQKDVVYWMQAIETGLNEIILLAVTILFLVGLDVRIKRRRALKAIHELRSIAHVIDMHQLTKNPERFVYEWTRTENSPKRTMTAFELNRYLDYCSEMLSLTGKIAALYVQHFDDAEAVAAVSEVEQLTTGLSRKIWQKIMILEQTRHLDRNTPAIAGDDSSPS